MSAIGDLQTGSSPDLDSSHKQPSQNKMFQWHFCLHSHHLIPANRKTTGCVMGGLFLQSLDSGRIKNNASLLWRGRVRFASTLSSTRSNFDHIFTLPKNSLDDCDYRRSFINLSDFSPTIVIQELAEGKNWLIDSIFYFYYNIRFISSVANFHLKHITLCKNTS